MKEYITKEAAINIVWDVLSKERRDNANTFHMISERLARCKADRVLPTEMEKFILISVRENQITTSSYSELPQAQLQMMTELCDAAGWDLHDCSDPEWHDDECCYDQYSAEVYDGTNHDNYSWLIVDTKD